MEGMMTQLLSKEFLHEPLSEIAAKYPAWLAEHGPSLYAPHHFLRHACRPFCPPARLVSAHNACYIMRAIVMRAIVRVASRDHGQSLIVLVGFQQRTVSAVTRSAEDHARYTRQLAVVREICDTYEKEPDNTDKVVELMQRMQECGQPPPDIVKELGGGVELDENGMPKGLVSGL
jgi:hypothetical protein